MILRNPGSALPDCVVGPKTESRRGPIEEAEGELAQRTKNSRAAEVLIDELFALLSRTDPPATDLDVWRWCESVAAGSCSAGEAASLTRNMFAAANQRLIRDNLQINDADFGMLAHLIEHFATTIYRRLPPRFGPPRSRPQTFVPQRPRPRRVWRRLGRAPPSTGDPKNTGARHPRQTGGEPTPVGERTVFSERTLFPSSPLPPVENLYNRIFSERGRAPAFSPIEITKARAEQLPNDTEILNRIIAQPRRFRAQYPQTGKRPERVLRDAAKFKLHVLASRPY